MLIRSFIITFKKKFTTKWILNPWDAQEQDNNITLLFNIIKYIYVSNVSERVNKHIFLLP